MFRKEFILKRKWLLYSHMLEMEERKMKSASMFEKAILTLETEALKLYGISSMADTETIAEA